jgi:hypothetical protein
MLRKLLLLSMLLFAVVTPAQSDSLPLPDNLISSSSTEGEELAARMHFCGINQVPLRGARVDPFCRPRGMPSVIAVVVWLVYVSNMSECCATKSSL